MNIGDGAARKWMIALRSRLARMAEWLSQFISTASGTAKIRSQALRPFLSYSVVCMLIGVPLMLFGALGVQIVGGILALHHIPITAYAALYLLKKHPDRLGSEVFVTQQNLLKFAEQAKDVSLIHVGEVMRLVGGPSPPATQKAVTQGNGSSTEDSKKEGR